MTILLSNEYNISNIFMQSSYVFHPHSHLFFLSLAWASAPLPPAKRAYGVHVNAGVAKGREKITYGHGNIAIIRDLENLEQVEVFKEHKAKVNVVTISPNGNWVASGDDSGQVYIWGYPNQIVKTSLRIGSSISDIRWSGDSKRVIAAGDGSTEYAKAFNFDSTNPLGKIDRITKKILSADWSPAMPHRVVTADEDLTVNFYHGVPFKHDSRSMKHSRFPNVVRYAPNGSVFATVGSDAKVIIYDGKTGEYLREFEDKENGHTGSIFGLAWKADSSELVTSSADKTVKVWNVESGKVVKSWTVSNNSGEFDDQQAGCLWSPSGVIASISISGAITFFNREQDEPTNVLLGHSANLMAYAFDRVNKVAYTGDLAGRISKWDLNTGVASWFKNNAEAKPITALAVSADGKILYSGAQDNAVRANSVEGLSFGGALATTKSSICAIAAGRVTNDLVAFATKQGQLSLIRNNEVVATTTIPEATQMTFNADDSELIIAGGATRVLYFFKIDGNNLVSNGKSADEIQAFAGTVESGKYLVSTQQNEVLIWNEDRTACVNPGWAYHTLRITSLSLSPDNSMIATGAQDKQIIVWREVDKFKPRPTILSNVHASGIYAVHFLDNETLVTIGDDAVISTIKLKL